MGKFLIVLCMLLFFFSCEQEKKKKSSKPEKSLVHLLSYDKAVKMVGKYTGRHDTTMYLHRWIMEFDGDRVDENVLVSEMLSDPHPLVSVYFKKKDTLVFIPVPAVSGSIPEVQELSLIGKTSQLGVWYTSRGKDGSYTYNFSAYAFSDYDPFPMFTFCLATIMPDGTILKPRTIEFSAFGKDGVVIKLYEAKAIADRTEMYMNKGPLLVKNSKESVEEYVCKWYPGNGVFKPYEHFYPIKGKDLWKVKIAPGQNY